MDPLHTNTRPTAVSAIFKYLLSAGSTVLESFRSALGMPFNQPNGVPQLDENGNLVGPIIPRSMTKAEADLIVPALGEEIHYTDVRGKTVGDGVTAGGWPDYTLETDADLLVTSTSTFGHTLLSQASSPGVFELSAFVRVQSEDGIVEPNNYRLWLAGHPIGGSNGFNDDGYLGTESHSYEVPYRAGALDEFQDVAINLRSVLISPFSAGSLAANLYVKSLDGAQDSIYVKAGSMLRIRKVG